MENVCRFFDDEESAKEKRQELQPMIQCLPDDIVVLNNTDTIDKGVNQNTPTQISNFEVGNMNQIVSYIPYNCLNIDTMPFTQKHPENAIGWAEIFLKASSTELIYSVDEKVFREWDGRYWKIVTDE